MQLSINNPTGKLVRKLSCTSPKVGARRDSSVYVSGVLIASVRVDGAVVDGRLLHSRPAAAAMARAGRVQRAADRGLPTAHFPGCFTGQVNR